MKAKALIIVLVAVAICSTALAFYPTWKADRIRAYVVATDWLHTDAEAVRRLSEKFGGSGSCDSGSCEYNVVVNNRMLSMIHLAPSMYFNLSIHTDGANVRDYVASIGENGKKGKGRWSTIWIIRTFVNHGWENQQAYEAITSSAHNGHGVYVKLSPFATTEQQATMLNGLETRCLSRVWGCSEQQLGPAIWKLGSFAHRVE